MATRPDVTRDNYSWADDFIDVFPETSDFSFALVDKQGIIRGHSKGLGDLCSAQLISLVGMRADTLLVNFVLPKQPSGTCTMIVRNPNGCGRLKTYWKRTRAGFLFIFIDLEPILMEKVPKGILSVVETQDLLHDLRTTLTTIQLASYEMKPFNPFDEHQGERVQLLLRESWAQERIFTAVGARTREALLKPILNFHDYLSKIFDEFEFTMKTRGISFTFNAPQKFPLVHCDAKRLEQCLFQLICLACNDREARSMHVEVSLSRDKKRVSFGLRALPPRIHRPCAEQFSMAFANQFAEEHCGRLTLNPDGFQLMIPVIPETYIPEVFA